LQKTRSSHLRKKKIPGNGGGKGKILVESAAGKIDTEMV